MSGIVGSKLNIRGSGLIGSLGTDGQHLLSSGAGKTNTFEAAAAAGVTAAEGTAIRQDVTTLALKQAVTENQAAFNLPNSFIDQFESDSGIATETQVDRQAAEYVNTITLAYDYDQTVQTTNSLHTGTTGSWTNAVTNDSVAPNLPLSGKYPNGYINWIYDLAADWKIRLFKVVKTDGAQTSETYGVWNQLITTDTSIAAGVDTAGASSDGRAWRAQDSSSNGSHTDTFLTAAAEWGDTQLIASYASTIGSDSASPNNPSDGAFGHYQIDCSGLTSPFINQAYAGVSPATYGWQVIYDRDANTIQTKQATNAAFTTFSSDYTTFNNVPATGRYFFHFGGGGYNTNNYYSTTYASVADAEKGYVAIATHNATGTVIGTANVPSSAQTKVSGVMLYKDEDGTASIGTDLKIYFTCNGGTNWTEASGYTAVTPVFSSGIKMVKLAQTTCTTGSDVRYKAVWANQSSGSKETRLQGIGINY